MKTMAVVLAAGQGTRMKSKLHKVLHPICGKAMVAHVVDEIERAGVERAVVVVGKGAQSVKKELGPHVEYALQTEQLGTGHAVMQAESILLDEAGTTFVLYGDTPLIRAESLLQMLQLHKDSNAAATLLTARVDDPHGYGRVIRNETGGVVKIVEQKDCTEEEANVQEINTGIGCFDNKKLFAALKKVNNHNSQQEYYLTDVIGIMRDQGERIEASVLTDVAESVGVNDRVALAEADRLMRDRINKFHMHNGVTMIDPTYTYIDADVQIGADTVIHPGTRLQGKTKIGADCVIGPHADLKDTVVSDKAEVIQSVVEGAEIGKESCVGPFAYIRPQTRLGQRVKVGDFVEVKNATIGDDTKVAHLSYVGDAVIGKDVNIGCGAITVNYDGHAKHVTEIDDEAFVGSNVNLIAPVKVERGAYVVAGSTITRDVPQDSMAIARERQTNKPGYANIIRSKIQQRDQKGER